VAQDDPGKTIPFRLLISQTANNPQISLRNSSKPNMPIQTLPAYRRRGKHINRGGSLCLRGSFEGNESGNDALVWLRTLHLSKITQVAPMSRGMRSQVTNTINTKRTESRNYPKSTMIAPRLSKGTNPGIACRCLATGRLRGIVPASHLTDPVMAKRMIARSHPSDDDLIARQRRNDLNKLYHLTRDLENPAIFKTLPNRPQNPVIKSTTRRNAIGVPTLTVQTPTEPVVSKNRFMSSQRRLTWR
jgi:hypothetical protein